MKSYSKIIELHGQTVTATIYPARKRASKDWTCKSRNYLKNGMKPK